VFWMNSMNRNSLNKTSTAHFSDECNILTFHVPYISTTIVHYSRECSYLTTWLESLSTSGDGREKMYRFCQKHGFLFLHDLLFTGRHLLGIPFITNLNSSLCTAMITYNTTEEIVLSHAHWIRVHFGFMYF